MFPLGARFKYLRLLLDAVFNAGVIADFKMQAVVIITAAPVPAVKFIFALEADGGGHRPVLMSGKYGA